MPTYKAIASTTVGSGGASSITFSSIPQTYTDLVILVSARSTFTVNPQAALYIGVNGNSTSANYSERRLDGNGSAASSATSSTQIALWGTVPANSATSNTFGNAMFYFPNYAGSTQKSFSGDGVGENNTTTAYSELAAFLIADTAAITSITLATDSNFAQYSTATLYGIKNS